MAKHLSVSKVFDRIGYVPHEAQLKIHNAKATHRFRWVSAGRRIGKSTAGGHELTTHAYEAYFRQNELHPHGRRMEYWIVGPEYSDAEKEFRVLYKDLETQGFVFDRPGTYYDAVGGNMHLSLFGGRFQVHAKSAKYPDTLVGESLDGVILAEAAKLRSTIWPKYLRPMLIDYRGWALGTSTPEGKNWFYEEYMRAISGDPEYWSLKAPSWMNNVLFPLGTDDPELASLAAGLTDEAFKQEIAADFTEFVGRVFKNFDEEVHCRPLEYNPAYATYAAVDYGWSNPFVWLLIQVDHWDNVYVIGEYYASHKRIEEIGPELIAQGLVPNSLVRFYPDPASPGDTASLSNILKVGYGDNTGGEIQERLDLIRKWLEIPPALRHLPYDHPERLPKLFVDPRKCPQFVREFNDYRYPENKSEQRDPSENPLKKDDHTPEALGRFMRGHFGHKEAPQKARVRKSKLVSRAR